jgi:hypothetical protein
MKNLKRIFQITLVSLGSFYIFACSNAANAPAVSNISAGAGCPTGIGGMDASCCDSSGTILSPAPAGCNVIVPGMAGVTNPLNSGASAGSAVGQTTAAAAQLTGGQNGMGLASGESAATAGQVPVSTSLTPIGAALGQSGLGVTASGNANAGTGGLSGTGDASGNIGTAPAPVNSSNPNSLASTSGSGTDTGAYGSGGGVLPNGAHSTGFQFGNGFANADGAGAAGSAELGFGAQRNLASMNGEDPADYFTRIGLQDSLFKKVERRYRSTSANWETTALNSIQVKTPK